MKNIFTEGLFPLTIRGYAVVFLFFALFLFTGLGWYALERIEQVHQTIEQKNQDAAREELARAAEHLLAATDRLTSKIEAWEEVFQQFADPSYYSYWHKHRLSNTNILPAYISSAKLYDETGQGLSELASDELPRNIPADRAPTLHFRKNTVYLVVYLPLMQGEEASIRGFMGLSIPFIEALVQLQNFQTLKEETLKYSGSIEKPLRLDQTFELFEYQIRTSPEVYALSEVVKSSVLHLGLIVGFLCLIYYLITVYLISSPLIKISLHIDQLRKSTQADDVVKLSSRLPVAELEKIRSSLNQYQSELDQLHENLQQKHDELWQLAHHDALTGVKNRRGFDLAWQNAVEVLQNRRIGFALMLFDINHFKAINDSYGHAAADEVLKVVTKTISLVLRKGECLHRMGGDEFSVILIGNDNATAKVIAKRCLTGLNAYDYSSLGINEPIRVSIGIAHCQTDQLDHIKSLMWQADMALYRAKRPSVNYPVMFTQDMADGSESMFSSWMNNAIYEAVTHRVGLEPFYQIIVDAATGKDAYCEALIRIRHKSELIPPSNIFPLVEARGLEADMDRAIIQCIAEDIANHHLPEGMAISVNLSAASIVHPDLIEWLDVFIGTMERNPIILEVTETSLITQLNEAVKVLQELRDKGFKVALDDFGSGYSSLQYLATMPVDTVKFDIALVRQIEDERVGKMVRQLAAVLKELGFSLVAEGVETESSYRAIQAAGFDYVQGFLFGKPERNLQLAHRTP